MKRISKFLKELDNLRSKAKKDGIEEFKFHQLLAKYADVHRSRTHSNVKDVAWIIIVLVLLASLLVIMNPLDQTELCLIDVNPIISDLVRPLSSCNGCAGKRHAPVLRDVTEAEFVENYAFSGMPVIVKGSTANWTARDVFSFEFFQDLYLRREDYLRVQEEECQFFGYNTEFNSLREAFAMSPRRANCEQGEEPWYFGWSNCVVSITNILKQYYQRPHFLPRDSYDDGVDWIFIGGHGRGATLHLDYVSRPSWQAQIRGRKTWTLVPVPECEHVCHELNVTMETGDILVLDTTRWYHATFIHPGDLSITIGAEYD